MFPTSWDDGYGNGYGESGYQGYGSFMFSMTDKLQIPNNIVVHAIVSKFLIFSIPPVFTKKSSNQILKMFDIKKYFDVKKC